MLLVIAVVGGVVLARRSGQRPASRARAASDEPDEQGRDRSRLVEITPTYYLILAAVLFTIGGVGLLSAATCS